MVLPCSLGVGPVLLPSHFCPFQQSFEAQSHDRTTSEEGRSGRRTKRTTRLPSAKGEREEEKRYCLSEKILILSI